MGLFAKVTITFNADDKMIDNDFRKVEIDFEKFMEKVDALVESDKPPTLEIKVEETNA